MTRINNRNPIQLLLLALVALALSNGLAHAQGYIEINQAVIDAQGGFPYTISEPGYYRFTGNVIKDATDGTTAAIVIDASGVTLDLADFFLAGPGTCARNPSTGVVTCTGHVPGTGIQESGNSDITIKNGIVKGFFNGISTTAYNTLIDRLQVSQNAFVGVSSIGDSSVINQVSSQRNGANGIVVQNNSLVTLCNATQNDDYGILANLNSAVTRSFATGNRLGGMSLNSNVSFSQNQVLDNFGADPVFSGIDDGTNTCTNAVGTSVGC